MLQEKGQVKNTFLHGLGTISQCWEMMDFTSSHISKQSRNPTSRHLCLSSAGGAGGTVPHLNPAGQTPDTLWELAPAPACSGPSPLCQGKACIALCASLKEHGQITRQLNPVICLSLLLVLLSIILNDTWQETRFAFDL